MAERIDLVSDDDEPEVLISAPPTTDQAKREAARAAKRQRIGYCGNGGGDGGGAGAGERGGAAGSDGGGVGASTADTDAASAALIAKLQREDQDRRIAQQYACGELGSPQAVHGGGGGGSDGGGGRAADAEAHAFAMAASGQGGRLASQDAGAFADYAAGYDFRYDADAATRGGGGTVLRYGRGGGGGGGGGGSRGQGPAARAALEEARNVNRVLSSTTASLKADQDADFNAQLAVDIQQREAREAEKKKTAREAAEEEEEAQMSKALARSSEQEQAAALGRKRARLGVEPPAGGERGSSTQLRVQLPAGKKLQRRFRPADTLQTVRDFVDVSLADMAAQEAAKAKAREGKEDKEVGGEGARQPAAIMRYTLTMNYPRRTFDDSKADTAVTLKAAQLVPSATLFLQDKDA